MDPPDLVGDPPRCAAPPPNAVKKRQGVVGDAMGGGVPGGLPPPLGEGLLHFFFLKKIKMEKKKKWKIQKSLIKKKIKKGMC